MKGEREKDLKKEEEQREITQNVTRLVKEKKRCKYEYTVVYLSFYSYIYLIY